MKAPSRTSLKSKLLNAARFMGLVSDSIPISLAANNRPPRLTITSTLLVALLSSVWAQEGTEKPATKESTSLPLVTYISTGTQSGHAALWSIYCDGTGHRCLWEAPDAEVNIGKIDGSFIKYPAVWIAPDRRHIAFLAGFDHWDLSKVRLDLYIVDLKDLKVKRLTHFTKEEATVDKSSVQWSATGNRIAYLFSDHNGKNLGVTEVTGKSHVIAKKNECHISHFSWSPSGSQLVYSGRTNNRRGTILCLTKWDGSAKRVLSTLSPAAASTKELYRDGFQSLTWSDSGKFFAYNNWDPKTGERRLWIEPTSGGDAKLLASYPAAKDDNVGLPDSIRFSPDGKRISWLSDGPSWRDPSKLYLADVNGENLHLVASSEYRNPIANPQFSPDGQRLSFQIGSSKIAVIHTETPSKIVDVAGKLNTWLRTKHISWSPDSTRLFFEYGEYEEGSRVYWRVVSAKGDWQRDAEGRKQEVGDPSWFPHFWALAWTLPPNTTAKTKVTVPDTLKNGRQLTSTIGGRWILFSDYNQIKKTWEVYSLRVDSGAVIKLTNHPKKMLDSGQWAVR